MLQYELSLLLRCCEATVYGVRSVVLWSPCPTSPSRFYLPLTHYDRAVLRREALQHPVPRWLPAARTHPRHINRLCKNGSWDNVRCCAKTQRDRNSHAISLVRNPSWSFLLPRDIEIGTALETSCWVRGFWSHWHQKNRSHFVCRIRIFNSLTQDFSVKNLQRTLPLGLHHFVSVNMKCSRFITFR